MLETPEERVRLLRAGISGKTIERLYIIHNNIKIVHNALPFESVEINNQENKNSLGDCEATAECEAVYI